MHYRTLLREEKYPNVTTFPRNIPLRALRHYLIVILRTFNSYNLKNRHTYYCTVDFAEV